MNYMWEPVVDRYYPNGLFPERTIGYHYHVLHVEQTLEGWHGILMVMDQKSWYEEDADLDGLYMLDEAVFDAKYDAVKWCEDKDLKAITQEEEDECQAGTM